jgi:hypothetical protein
VRLAGDECLQHGRGHIAVTKWRQLEGDGRSPIGFDRNAPPRPIPNFWSLK